MNVLLGRVNQKAYARPDYVVIHQPQRRKAAKKNNLCVFAANNAGYVSSVFQYK